jgi:hypothetical protein
MLNLEPIKARLAAATPGPWEIGEVCEDASRRFVSGAGLIIATPRSWEGHYDAELISHAPSDLAALVAEVERLQALVAEDLKQTPSEETYIGDFEGYRIFVADKKLEKCLNWQDAMSYVDQIGYSLPTKEELNFIYEAKDQFYESEGKAFMSTFYWSSTEFSSTFRWGQYFSDGNKGFLNKTFPLYVRPIRREKIDA